jgi:cation diffusion facilitator CzcD-associated flavoprotein CzcO
MAPRAEQPPAFDITALKGSFPTLPVDNNIDPLPIAQASLIQLQFLDSGLLTEDTLWRDLFTLTGSARTFNGISTIQSAWKTLCASQETCEFKLVPGGVRIVRPSPALSWIEVKFTFRATAQPPRLCMGNMRLVPDEQQTWKIWTLVTILQSLDGFPNVDECQPAMEWESNVDQLPSPVSDSGFNDLPLVQDCVVVGAGMAGLCVAGYLKALGTNAVILERNIRVGQNWTDRELFLVIRILVSLFGAYTISTAGCRREFSFVLYVYGGIKVFTQHTKTSLRSITNSIYTIAGYESVKIHTSRSVGQLPFEPPIWGPEYPYHLSIKDLDEGYNKFVKRYNLDVWLSTNLEKARWNGKTQSWTLQINQRGMRRELRARHLVMAIGGGGQVPRLPHLANRSSFKGTVLHSAKYKHSRAWGGLRGVVVGTANSGHDIANDMLQAGLKSATMVQRGRTPVLPVEYYSSIYDPMFNDNIPVATSDLMAQIQPTAITRLMALAAVKRMASQDPERFDALERQGFRVERFVDIYQCLYERFGSHYLDVGVSQKIGQGLIKVKSDAALVGFTETGLQFDDGSVLEADVVVFATGFEGNMRLAVADIVGQEISDTLDDYWHVDSEGELRGVWKPIGRKYLPSLTSTPLTLTQSLTFNQILAYGSQVETSCRQDSWPDFSLCRLQRM